MLKGSITASPSQPMLMRRPRIGVRRMNLLKKQPSPIRRLTSRSKKSLYAQI